MKPVLILLPGMDGTGELFAPFIAALGDTCEVRVVRYPGHHQGGYPALEAIARAAIPTDRPYVLLGESFSGPTAISIAASAPGHLRGLILCCTFARNPHPGLNVLQPLLGVIPVKAMPFPLLAHLLMGRFASPGLRSDFAQAFGQVTPAAMRARLRAVLTVDVRQQLAACPTPVLYLQARHDRVVPASAWRLIAATKPDAQVKTLDAPHFLLQAAAEPAAAEVAAFLRFNAPT